MEARAVRKHIRSAPRKMRTVINLIRGKRVAEAIGILQHMPQAATRPVALTLQSAVHNLTDRYRDERIDEDDLVVREIRIDEGPVFKRFQPVSRGRGHRILKRTSHLTVVIGTRGDGAR